MIRHIPQIAVVLIGSLVGADASAFPPFHCGIPPWDPPPPNQTFAGRPDANIPNVDIDTAGASAMLAKPDGYSLSPVQPAHTASLDFGDNPIGTLPGWNGGTGENCHLFHASDALDWDRITQVNYTTRDFAMAYVEAPLRSLQNGQALDLRLQLDLSELIATATPADLSVVELDLDRGDQHPLLPVRLVVNSTMHRAPTVALRTQNAHTGASRVLQGGAVGSGVSELHVHWLQLDPQRGELSLRVDGRVVGSNVLAGTLVALRVGDLDLPAADASHGAIRLRSASLSLEH
ncbi:MAG: hypothetical protein ABI411_10735 [Tahibacter sp.]